MKKRKPKVLNKPKKPHPEGFGVNGSIALVGRSKGNLAYVSAMGLSSKEARLLADWLLRYAKWRESLPK